MDLEKLETYLKIYQTSSPSYVLLSSITECIGKIKSEGIFLLEPYVRRLLTIDKYAEEFTHLRLLNRSIVGKNSVADYDISKIVISSRGTGCSGKWLYDNLLERFHLQLEMCSGDYVLAMTSFMDSEEGLLRLFTALAEIDRDMRVYGGDLLGQVKPLLSTDFKLPEAIVSEPVSMALSRESEVLSWEKALGKISAEYVYLYPPGIPLVAPGEILTHEVLALIERYKKSGLKLHGTQAKNAEAIRVVKENFRRISLVQEIF